MQLLKLCSVRRSDVSAHGENVKQRLSGNLVKGTKGPSAVSPFRLLHQPGPTYEV